MLKIKNSILAVIDVQGRLAELMHEKDHLFKTIQATIQSAHHLGIPLIATEQAPDKIGETAPEVAALLSGTKPIKKTSFSCCGSAEFVNAVKASRRSQVIVTGIETHVCVYQTVRDLRHMGFEVHVLADGVSSRSIANKAVGLQRCEQEGAVISSFEMAVTELMTTADHEKFRDIVKLMKPSTL